MSTNGVPEVLKSKGVSAETVKALSAFKDEPAWLTEKRLEAWRVFEEMPMPTLRDEAWRYTDISDVRVEDFLPYSPSPDVTREGDLPDAVQRLIKEGEANSALLVQHNSETTFVRVDEESEAERRRLHRPAHRSQGARGPGQGAPLRAGARELRQVRGLKRGGLQRRVVPLRAARG